MEPEKIEDNWKWFPVDAPPAPLFGPLREAHTLWAMLKEITAPESAL